ncbi:MAG: DNA-directed RNA polymerase, subunit E'' [Desulfurococcaceae archaeon]|jgi:DNA-directed RNA polymerase subunit E"|nr:DNA-directed RNA polymerase, subunit E'' [Desulfurococcaceae archaeon]
MSSKSRGKPFKACRSCRALVDKEVEVCPVCGSRDFTDEWSGVVVILNPEESEIAKLLNLKNKGRFVVKIE